MEKVGWRNLLQETIKELKQHSKPLQEVLFVCDDKHYASWEWFVENADFEYNCFRAGINSELKVVGKDWWLERAEYDGSGWWEFKTLPLIKGKVTNPFKLRS